MCPETGSKGDFCHHSAQSPRGNGLGPSGIDQRENEPVFQPHFKPHMFHFNKRVTSSPCVNAWLGSHQLRMLTEAIITAVSHCVIKGVVSDLVKESFSKAFFCLDNVC